MSRYWGLSFIHLILSFCFVNLCCFFFAKSSYANSKFNEFNFSASENNLNIATWNVRQTTSSKANVKIKVNGKSKVVSRFIVDWLNIRSIDALAMQEFYERVDLDKNQSESPLKDLQKKLDKKYEIILGSPIRDSILRGNASSWREYCPIIFNSDKLECYGSNEPIKIGYDLDQKNMTLQTPRYVNWAYCEAKNKKFDFILSCVHTNFKTSEEHVLGLANVISKVRSKQVLQPSKFSEANIDFIFAGDFNLDRRTTRSFVYLAQQGFPLDDQIPLFPPGTLWKKDSFTKLKDSYVFSEVQEKSNDIYDDVVHTLSTNESMIGKYVDPLIDDFFITANSIDMQSLLSLSDHLPVVATYDLAIDTD